MKSYMMFFYFDLHEDEDQDTKAEHYPGQT